MSVCRKCGALRGALRGVGILRTKHQENSASRDRHNHQAYHKKIIAPLFSYSNCGLERLQLNCTKVGILYGGTAVKCCNSTSKGGAQLTEIGIIARM